jgi:hypothetical protein
MGAIDNSRNINIRYKSTLHYDENAIGRICISSSISSKLLPLLISIPCGSGHEFAGRRRVRRRFGLLDNESDGTRWMRGLENTIAVPLALAIAVQAVSETFRDYAPGDAAARRFLQLDRVLAAFDIGKRLKASLYGLLSIQHPQSVRRDDVRDCVAREGLQFPIA